MIVEFAAGSLRGASRLPGSLEHQIERARAWLDPASALGTVHWGRNYLYRASGALEQGTGEVVVKQYRWSGTLARLRRKLRGDRAARSFEVACAFEAAGIPTPRPYLWATNLDRGVSIFVSEWLEGWIELRDPLRARNFGEDRQRFAQLNMFQLLRAVAQLARQLHDAGFWFRDFSVGNILLGPDWLAGGGRCELSLVDLARCRQLRKVSSWKRFRDLARLPLEHREDRCTLLEAYCGGHPRSWDLGLLRFLQWSFHGRHAIKRRLRGLSKKLRSVLFRRGVHAHIPPAPPHTRPRDQVVWDPLSDQPHGHSSRVARLWIRLVDAPYHLRHLGSIVASTGSVYRTYRKLRRKPPPLRLWPEVGVGLRPDPQRRTELLEALEELGVRRALLRLHPWEEDHEDEEQLARELAARGFEVALALPQNRELVKDRARWRHKVEELGRRFLPYAGWVQIGQAVNRSKWGVWHPDEYLKLTLDAVEILRGLDPEVELAGPAVIDFELHHAAGLLRQLGPEPILDRLSTLLYVDRRGAPEAQQLGFDTEAKVLLAAAIAQSSSAIRLPGIWISEVNWPLREGPHSPAGRHVAVDEHTQAQFLARYLLLATSTGQVDRIDWWQLAARGYGLLEPVSSGFRRRPAFQALRVFQASLRGCQLVAQLVGTGPLYARAFRRPDGRELWTLWSAAGGQKVELLQVPEAVWDLLGNELPAGRTVDVGGDLVWLLWPGPVESGRTLGTWISAKLDPDEV